MPYIVGLTGGIGSGKSTISALFHELGAEIIDADEISHALVQKNTPTFNSIIKHFSIKMLDADGNLNRSALRQIVFNDPTEKNWLEALLHPAIRKEITDKLERSTADYVILAVPLLLESGNYDFVNTILVIDIPESLQIERTTQRDGSSKQLIQQIITSQISRHERLQHADDIIDNTDSLDQVKKQVARLHEKYLRESRSAR